MTQQHVLKTKEPFFSAVKSGAKTFEVRQYTEQTCTMRFPYAENYCNECKLDPDHWWTKCSTPTPARDFKVGDELKLIDPDGFPIYCDITYVLKDTDYPDGIKPGFCVLGIKVIC